MVIITEVATGAKLTGKTCARVSLLRSTSLLKKETLTQVFFCKLFSHRTPSTAASVISQYTRKINRIWNVTLNIYLPETRLEIIEIQKNRYSLTSSVSYEKDAINKINERKCCLQLKGFKNYIKQNFISYLKKKKKKKEIMLSVKFKEGSKNKPRKTFSLTAVQ